MFQKHEGTKFWMIRRYLDIKGVISSNEHTYITCQLWLTRKHLKDDKKDSFRQKLSLWSKALQQSHIFFTLIYDYKSNVTLTE